MAPESVENLKILLSPLSFFYEMGVRFRNQLFNWGLLSSEQFGIPVICIGNLTAGGTGKTPHAEYLIRLLHRRYRIAVLSRGYKRLTKGFILADANSTSEDIGDEPFQMKEKFRNISVAVDSDRRRGIRRLLEMPEDKRPEVILLDDGYQHRYVTPSLSIVLTDYNRPFYDEKLLPVGRLREPALGIRRADIVIVTKCNKEMKPIEYRIIEGRMNLLANQELFFTQVKYGEIKPVFPSEAYPRVKRDIRKNDDVLVVSGIAYPEDFIREIRKYSGKVTALSFSDHHQFIQADIEKINTAFNQMTSSEKLIIVTEKDAARFLHNQLIPESWKERIYAQPIQIEFHAKRESQFDEIILKHINSIQQNGITR